MSSEDVLKNCNTKMKKAFDIFNQVMTKCTENFECLVLDNTSRSNEIEDVVFYLSSPTFEAAAKLYNQSKENIPITYDTAAIYEQLKNNNE